MKFQVYRSVLSTGEMYEALIFENENGYAFPDNRLLGIDIKELVRHILKAAESDPENVRTRNYKILVEFPRTPQLYFVKSAASRLEYPLTETEISEFWENVLKYDRNL